MSRKPYLQSLTMEDLMARYEFTMMELVNIKLELQLRLPADAPDTTPQMTLEDAQNAAT
jgi:hypothetical protein